MNEYYSQAAHNSAILRKVSMCNVEEWKALGSGKYFEEIEHIVFI